MTIILTNCTKRKRVPPVAELCARTLHSGSLETVVHEWKSRVASVNPAAEAIDFYCGRQFSEARSATAALEGRMLILSAGLGTLLPTELVVPYSLTIASGSPDNILSVTDEEVTPAEWWRALTAEEGRFRGLRFALTDAGSMSETFLIALPSQYLRMVEHELMQLPTAQLLRTRIFTVPTFRFRDQRLNSILMPYDTRLDGPDSPRRGTASNFAARALHDFSTEILPMLSDASGEAHSRAVSRRLETWRAVLRPERTGQTDAELLNIIRENWSQGGGSASQMLRKVRSELGIACEQTRMKTLYELVREEMQELS